MRRFLRGMAPIACFVAGACFATRSDVQVLQTDVQTLRAERTRADSAVHGRLTGVLASLTAATDSMRALGLRFTRLQGEVRGDLYAMSQQLIQIQELTGQSQRRLQELRSSLEARQQEVVPAPVPVAGDTVTTSRPTAPGPNQIFQASLDQMRRGNAATARAGFEELLRLYPSSDLAPDAQFYLGEAYKAEGNAGAADTAYATVVNRYPKSPRAPTALYKRALGLEERGSTVAARAALNDIIQKYPRSDEAALARERLRTMR